MIGNRLKLIRQANGLSLQEMADLLVGTDLQIKRGALSHYELGITDPSDAALAVLARRLGTTVEFFKQPDWEDVSFSMFRSAELSNRSSTTLMSYLCCYMNHNIPNL